MASPGSRFASRLPTVLMLGQVTVAPVKLIWPGMATPPLFFRLYLNWMICPGALSGACGSALTINSRRGVFDRSTRERLPSGVGVAWVANQVQADPRNRSAIDTVSVRRFLCMWTSPRFHRARHLLVPNARIYIFIVLLSAPLCNSP